MTPTTAVQASPGLRGRTPNRSLPVAWRKALSGTGAAVLGFMLLAGCAGRTAPGDPPRCADLVARSFSSTTPVNGAFACLAPGLQQSARDAGLNNDADLATLASQPPVYTSYQYKYKRIDATKMYYYFEFTPNPACLRLHVDTSGLVDDGQWNRGACPGR